jgi:hypothetical protein
MTDETSAERSANTDSREREGQAINNFTHDCILQSSSALQDKSAIEVPTRNDQHSRSSRHEPQLSAVNASIAILGNREFFESDGAAGVLGGILTGGAQHR